MTTLVVNNTGQIVEFSETTVEVITAGLVGPQGPQGIPGPAGGAALAITAGQDLGGHRAVITTNGLAYYADNTDATHVNRVIGITSGAVSAGGSASVITLGDITGLSGLTPDEAIYLSAAGVLTQTVPASGFIQQLGTAIATDRMAVNIKIAIQQA
jgi:hypothetical protein